MIIPACSTIVWGPGGKDLLIASGQRNTRLNNAGKPGPSISPTANAPDVRVCIYSTYIIDNSWRDEGLEFTRLIYKANEGPEENVFRMRKVES